METLNSRPVITQFNDPVEFLKEMIRYRKKSEPGFSILKETRFLRKVSPALVTLILQGKRRISLDRADEFARLLNLNPTEKFYFKNWLGTQEKGFIETATVNHKTLKTSRKDSSLHLLNDWVNVYVKDYFMIAEVQKNPDLIYEKMAGVVSPSRIKKSIQFLLKQGYLKRKINGEIVVDTTLNVMDYKISSKKIRHFHKKALLLAKNNIDLYSSEERLANTATIALTQERYQELCNLIADFSEKFKEFASQEDAGTKKTKLYQLVINLSPLGGKTNA